MTLRPRHQAAVERGLDALGTLRNEDERVVSYAVTELLYHPRSDTPRTDSDCDMLAGVIDDRLHYHPEENR